jgi:hypothetical protein
MAAKVRGRSGESSPIPKVVVLADNSEPKASLQKLQVARLTRRCALSVGMAAIVAPLIFGEVSS